MYESAFLEQETFMPSEQVSEVMGYVLQPREQSADEQDVNVI